MSNQSSKPYEIDGSKYSFDIVDGKIAGIQKADSSGSFFTAGPENKYLNPNLSNFGDIASSDEAIEAYNIAKYGSNIDAYEDGATQQSSSELSSYFNQQKKKAANKAAVDNNSSGVYGQYMPSNPDYRGAGNNKKYKEPVADVYAYPSDIDTNQDHLKIQKWEYVRQNINQSKASTRASQKTNIAGDSVKGSIPQGSVLLPMPKVVDVNGADWGENKLSIFGLSALGGSERIGKALGVTPGQTGTCLLYTSDAADE